MMTVTSSHVALRKPTSPLSSLWLQGRDPVSHESLLELSYQSSLIICHEAEQLDKCLLRWFSLTYSLCWRPFWLTLFLAALIQHVTSRFLFIRKDAGTRDLNNRCEFMLRHSQNIWLLLVIAFNVSVASTYTIWQAMTDWPTIKTIYLSVYRWLWKLYWVTEIPDTKCSTWFYFCVVVTNNI